MDTRDTRPPKLTRFGFLEDSKNLALEVDAETGAMKAVARGPAPLAPVPEDVYASEPGVKRFLRDFAASFPSSITKEP